MRLSAALVIDKHAPVIVIVDGAAQRRVHRRQLRLELAAHHHIAGDSLAKFGAAALHIVICQVSGLVTC